MKLSLQTKSVAILGIALVAASLAVSTPSFADDDVQGTLRDSRDRATDQWDNQTSDQSDDGYSDNSTNRNDVFYRPGYPGRGDQPGRGHEPGRDHGGGWGPGHGGGGWRRVQCRAENRRGMLFRGDGRSRREAMDEALDRCFRVSRQCRPYDCF